LRPLGRGGRTAAGSYDQISRYLRQNLSPEHASLFAEPSLRAGTFDWFSDFDAPDRPIRMLDADPKLRQEATARLARLTADIEARASSLRRSDRQDERILGDMLESALEIPDEAHIFVLGGRPVLTFWGHHKDQGQPALNPVKAVISRQAPPTADPVRSESRAASLPQSPAREEIADAPVRGRAASVPAALIWGIFAALLIVIGLMLLRSCAIGFPYRLTGWVLNYCPASADAALSAALDEERAKQDALRAEYAELLRRSDLKRQACFIKPPAPTPTPLLSPSPTASPIPIVTPSPTASPTPSPSMSPRMQLDPKPNQKNPLANIKGCWTAHDQLHEIRNHKSTGEILSVVFCFNEDGSGSRTIKFQKDGAECRAPAHAHFEGDILVIDSDVAGCDGGHGQFYAIQTKCKRAADGSATCDEYSSDDPKPDFTDFPFISTDKP
jgi:hypothetical protein